jgi:hypothetical protein
MEFDEKPIRKAHDEPTPDVAARSGLRDVAHCVACEEATTGKLLKAGLIRRGSTTYEV